MIAKVEFPYGMRDKFVALAQDEATYLKLRAIIFSAPEPENKDKDYYWPSETLLDTETDGKWLAERGIQFTIVNIKGTIALNAILPGGGSYVVNVQIPHIGLLMINEVQVEEDCCTERLQELLNQGWRLLCVCPPNAQRRPDYILGRTRLD